MKTTYPYYVSVKIDKGQLVKLYKNKSSNRIMNVMIFCIIGLP